MTAADAVDVILEQWERERPDLDLTATGILGRVSRIAALVEQSMDRVFQPHGLTGGDFVVLAALRRSGKPVPADTKRAEPLDDGVKRRHDKASPTDSKLAVSSDAIPTPPTGAARSSRSPVPGFATDRHRRIRHVRNEERLLATLSPNQRQDAHAAPPRAAPALRTRLRTCSESPLEES